MMFVKDHREMLGPVRSFDGQILYLPKKLPDRVSLKWTTAYLQLAYTKWRQWAANSFNAKWTSHNKAWEHTPGDTAAAT